MIVLHYNIICCIFALNNINYMDEYKRYIFIKEYVKSPSEKIPEGSEITYQNGRVFFNGGMQSPFYTKFFTDLIEQEKVKKEYLREIAIPYNKI